MNAGRTSPGALALGAMLLVITLAVTGCASGRTRFVDAEGSARIGGFTYQMPGVGWRAVLYPETKESMLSHHFKRDGDRLQFQLSVFAPYKPVRSQADIVAWAKHAGGPDAAADVDHGALCARYAHRWNQTLSLGGPPMPWTTIEERGLYCIDPRAPDRLLHARVLERLDPGARKSPDFDALAGRLLRDISASPGRTDGG